MILSDLNNLEETLPPLHHDMVSNEIFTKEQAIHARVAISILGPGCGAEIHVHPGSEHYFLMIEGKLIVRNGKEEIVALPGQCVLVEDGEPHQVINGLEDRVTKYFALGCPYPSEWKPVEED
jgi:mannose-6-phosphate isomerase-like protein (cupin superfamily)